MKNSLSTSKFAESQLKKYGWKEGDGIGKNNQGIIDPIKASFKFDNSGVGFNLADEFTVNWWDNLYNTTANKIDSLSNQVSTNEQKTQVQITSTTTTENGALNRKSFYYSRFTKGSTLVNGETLQTVYVDEKKAVKKESIKEESSDTSKLTKKILNDEELLRVCEGRTAHKGARHGIKMNGKLARVEEQEKLLLEKYLNKTKTIDHQEEINVNDESHKKKKKRKHKERDNENKEAEEEIAIETEIRPNESINDDLNESNEDSTSSKKKKKKKKSKANDE